MLAYMLGTHRMQVWPRGSLWLQAPTIREAIALTQIACIQGYKQKFWPPA